MIGDTGKARDGGTLATFFSLSSPRSDPKREPFARITRYEFYTLGVAILGKYVSDP